jgi:hypothetical protein
MNLYPLQTSFTSGILSPRFWSRSDLPQYRSGLKDSDNMIVTRHGPMESRSGTQFFESLGDNYARPFPFQLIPNNVTGEAFSAIAVEDGRLIVSGASGSVFQDDLTNTSFNVGLGSWSKIFTSGLSTVSWSSGAALLTPQKITNGASAGVSQFVNVPIGTENEDRTISFVSSMSSGSAQSAMVISVGSTSGGNDLASQLFNTDDGEMVFNPNGVTSYWITFSCFNNINIGAAPPSALDTIFGTRNLTSASSALTSSGAIEFAHPWSAEDIRTIQTEMAPNEFSMYFLCQDKAPQKLNYDLDTNTWSFGVVSLSGTPTSWVTGNYPTTLTFFQGRSWWAGVQSNPQTFWASKSNDETTVENELENLTVGTEANDGLEFSLSKAGRIRWMEGGGNLVIGTNAGEFLINGSQGLITPDDIFVAQQSAEGGESVNSIQVGSMIMFISGDGRKLLAIRYQEDQNQWRANEISFTAENLTQGKKIISIAYARNPEAIIWCLLDDGSLIGCTYDPTTGVMGWHKHSIANVLGISVSERSGFSILSLTVQRIINGATVTYLEELGTDYMDSYTAVETSSVNVSIPHLAGEEVIVKINDNQHPNITLDINGDGVLNYFEDRATIGLEMPISITTLETDLGSQAGSSMGYKKRYSEITARIYQSAVPLINGRREKVRYPETPMGFRQPDLTGDVTVNNLGYNDGSIKITQSLPYKLTITGLFGKMTQNTL